MTSKKSPSRLRYEERNPTISARVPRELKEQLQDHLDRTGQSYSEWIQVSFNSDDDIVIDTEAVWDKGYTEGYDHAVFDTVLYLFRYGWTEEVQGLESDYYHLDEQVPLDDWLTAIFEFTRHVQAEFPER